MNKAPVEAEHDLRAAVNGLLERVRQLEDQIEIMQLVAQYGPSVDSGSGDATAELWTEDGIYDVASLLRLSGRDEIADMVHGPAHQGLIQNGCAHVLTAPHVVVEGDEACGRSYSLNIRWDAATDRFWVARVSANTWRWVRTEKGWRTAERNNANLDGTPEHREMLAPQAGDGSASGSMTT